MFILPKNFLSFKSDFRIGDTIEDIIDRGRKLLGDAADRGFDYLKTIPQEIGKYGNIEKFGQRVYASYLDVVDEPVKIATDIKGKFKVIAPDEIKKRAEKYTQKLMTEWKVAQKEITWRDYLNLLTVPEKIIAEGVEAIGQTIGQRRIEPLKKLPGEVKRILEIEPGRETAGKDFIDLWREYGTEQKALGFEIPYWASTAIGFGLMVSVPDPFDIFTVGKVMKSDDVIKVFKKAMEEGSQEALELSARSLAKTISKSTDDLIPKLAKELGIDEKPLRKISKVLDKSVLEEDALKNLGKISKKISGREFILQPELWIKKSTKGGKYAININLDKIKTTDDIKTIVRRTADIFKDEIQKARRGVIRWSGTEEMAEKLGMTMQDLIDRLPGEAFNAEQIEAARNLLNQSTLQVWQTMRRAAKTGTTEDVIDAWSILMKHRAIQAQVSGLTAEAGRALQIFRKTIELPAVKALREIDKYFKVPDELARLEIMRRLAEIDPQDTLALNKFLRDVIPASFSDKVFEFWVNAILSSPRTHIVNITSNTATALLKPVEDAFEGVYDLLKHTLKRTPRQRFASEAIAEVASLKQGFREGLRRALYTFQHGIRPDQMGKLEMIRPLAVKGKKGEIIRLPGRFLIAADEFFKGLLSQMELYRVAWRKGLQSNLTGIDRIRFISELVDNPTPKMLNLMSEEALYRTFQTPLGKYGRIIAGLRRVPGIRFVMPFIRTPINIAKFGIERTPFSILVKAAKREPIKSADLAKATIGAITAGGLTMYFGEGKITGHAPIDPEERDAFYRQGKQSYSLKIGNKWISYQRVEPIATTLGVLSDFLQDWDRYSEWDREENIRAITATFTQNLTNKTFLFGLNQLLNAWNDPARYGERWIYSFASGFMPQAVRDIADIAEIYRLGDSYFRRPSSIAEAYYLKIPFLKEKVPPLVDLWGNPAKKSETIAEVFAPTYVSAVTETPIDKEMERLKYYPGRPRREIYGFDLNPHQYVHYQMVAGRLAKLKLDGLVKLLEYKALSDVEKIETIRDIISSARRYARETYGFIWFLVQNNIHLPEPVDETKAGELLLALSRSPGWRKLKPEEQRNAFINILDRFISL